MFARQMYRGSSIYESYVRSVCTYCALVFMLKAGNGESA